LFIILCGYPPFNGKTSKEVINKVKREKISFEDLEWRNSSKEVKDLILRLLSRDLDKRITLDEALNHEWFNQTLFNAGHNTI
jgi:calcium-dependent protein kinase